MDTPKQKTLEEIIAELKQLHKQNDENADKVKPTDLYYLGRASAFSDAVLMLDPVASQFREENERLKDPAEKWNSLKEKIDKLYADGSEAYMYDVAITASSAFGYP